MQFFLAVIRPSYWLTDQHPVPEGWRIALTVFFGLLLAIGVLSALLSARKAFAAPIRRFFSRFSSWGIVMGALGFLFLFFSLEEVAYISARAFYLLWAIIAIWWLVYILRYVFRDAPRLMEEQRMRDQREKYLPKRKKK